MPPRKRAGSKEPSGTPPAKRKARAAPSSSTDDAAEGAKPTPRRRGLRSATSTSSPVRVEDNPDRILRSKRGRGNRRTQQSSEEPEESSLAVVVSRVTPEESVEAEPVLEERDAESADREPLYPDVSDRMEVEEVETVVARPKLRSRGRRPQAQTDDDPVQGTPEGLGLLAMLTASKEEQQIQNEMEVIEEESIVEANSRNEPSTTTPKADSVQKAEPATPKSTGWGFGGFFKRFIPSFSSSSPAVAAPPVPATAPPKPTATLPQEVQNELQASLTPTRVPRRKTNARKTQVRPSGSRLPPLKTASYQDRTIAKQTLKTITPNEKAQAKQWFDETLQKIAQSEGKPGSKRKRFDQPVKIDELKQIPARAPWQSEGTFGLQADFFDESDEEAEVPGWHWLQLRAESEQQKEEDKPVKRRKLRDSHGASTSLTDLHPRSAVAPSSMFSDRPQSYQGGNIFAEDEAARAPQRKPKATTVEEQIRRSGHAPNTGAFGVPESDSEDEDSSILAGEDVGKAGPATSPAKTPQRTAPSSTTKETAPRGAQADETTAHQPWTQQPPPAPVPAHASLPGLSAAASTPARPVDDMAAKGEAARKKATQYAPKTPSRLREGSIPSPASTAAGGDTSFKPAAGADLGSGLLTQPHVAASTPRAQGATAAPSTTTPPGVSSGQQSSIPSAASFDSGKFLSGLGPVPDLVDFDNSPELEAALQKYIEAPDFAEKSAEMWKNAPGFSDLSEDDDVDELFPDGSKSLTASELDAEIGV